MDNASPKTPQTLPGPAQVQTAQGPTAGLLRWLGGPWPVALLLICFVALGAGAAMQKSPTFDETVHLTGGYSYWAFSDYRLHPENGNWSQRWSALPLWLVGYQFPDTGGNMWDVADAFFYKTPQNDAHNMMWQGRLMLVVPAAGLALLVYLWSRKLFGPVGGLISLTLCAVSPTILAYGFFTTSDMLVTLFLLAATWAVWTLLHRVTPATVLLAGFALGGAALAKFSGLLILPIAMVLLCVRLTNPAPWVIGAGHGKEIRGRARQLALFAALMAIETAVVVLMVWASYGFKFSIAGSTSLDNPVGHLTRTWEEMDTRSPLLQSTLQATYESRLLPEGYLYGLKYMVASSQERASFLNGAFSRTGFRSFFLWCLALKTPLAVFGLLGIAAAGSWLRPGSDATPGKNAWSTGGRVYECAPLVALFAVYWGFALSSNLNIGQRHLMPTYPVLFILAGAATLWFRPALQLVTAPPSAKSAGRPKLQSQRAPAELSPGVLKACRAAVVALLVVSFAQAVWIWPNYVTFFNILGGGPSNGYRHLVDSSYDWGQDLNGLVEWLDRNSGDAEENWQPYVAYFGTAQPEYYGLYSRRLPSYRTVASPDAILLRGGVYCIGATMLQSVYNQYPGRWNVEYEKLYQEARPVMSQLLHPNSSQEKLEFEKNVIAHLGRQQAYDDLRQAYAHLQFGRLCAYLRARAPDESVNHSILIYRLSDDEVRQSLEGPPPAETLPRREM